MNFIFLGPPGAGKGTLASVISLKHGIPHVSTGVIFREAIKANSTLGLKVKAIIDSGNLVNDDLTIELVQDRLSNPDVENGFILDGFPRTIAQANGLSSIISIDTVVNFNISDENVIKRLSGRRVCENCGQSYHIEFIKPKVEGVCDVCSGKLITRQDDKVESIKNRLEVYRNQTEPLIDFYSKKDVMYNLDASLSTQEILENFLKDFPVKC